MGRKKDIKEYNKLLRKFQAKREFVKLNRTVTEGEANIFGIILDFSDDYMHLAENEEFKFNGEVIIRMDHYDSIRFNKFDKANQRILKSEGHLSKTKPERTDVDLSSWTSIFKDLKKKDIHVIVECEDLKMPTFTIGPIISIKNKSLEVRNYDGTGKLEKKPTKIKFKDITLVKFNDEYSTVFRKYLKDSKK